MLPRDAARKDKCMKLQTNQSMQQTRRELQYIVILVAVFCRILPSGPPSRYRWCNDKETLWALDTCRTARIYELHRIACTKTQYFPLVNLFLSVLVATDQSVMDFPALWWRQHGVLWLYQGVTSVSVWTVSMKDIIDLTAFKKVKLLWQWCVLDSVLVRLEYCQPSRCTNKLLYYKVPSRFYQPQQSVSEWVCISRVQNEGLSEPIPFILKAVCFAADHLTIRFPQRGCLSRNKANMKCTRRGGNRIRDKQRHRNSCSKARDTDGKRKGRCTQFTVFFHLKICCFF